jgi:hypothetical protein
MQGVHDTKDSRAQGPKSIEITLFASKNGPLTKRIELAKDGSLITTPAATLTDGIARRHPIANGNEFAALLEQVSRNGAIALGALRADLPDEVTVTTKDKLNGAAGIIARTSDFVRYRKGKPALVLLDFDTKGMPANVKVTDFWATLVKVLPALSDAAHVSRRSTSSGLRRTDTGKKLPGSSGVHEFIAAQDGNDIERFLTTLHERCWLAGFGWFMISKAGTLLERSIIDRSVGRGERLVFEASPILVPPLAQDAKSRRPIATEGEVLDTITACPPLSAAERARFDKLVAEAKKATQPKADEVRATYVEEQAEALVKNKGLTKEAAIQVIESKCRGVLLSDVELEFSDKNLKGSTVGDVLGDPERFDRKTLADPIEGVSYGRTTAKVLLRRDDGTPWIKSFAHGGVSYSLQREEEAEAKVPSDKGVSLHNFRSYMPLHNYIFMPTRDLWPSSSVNARVPPVPLFHPDGAPVLDENGEQEFVPASVWIDKNAPVEQMTWAPGLPLLICDRIISEGGWIERQDTTVFNLYRAPTIELGDASKAGPWLDHVRQVYPDDADHILQWFAQRVQRPQDKINHALVFGGKQGIGKDTILEPVKRAVGPWNVQEVSPKAAMGRFNGFLKSVILRVNEARDQGEVSRYDFYDAMKAYTAAPPDVLRVDEKNLREHSILNCCGVIFTTNYKQTGIYLPADDRRHYVCWSDLSKEDFSADYWPKIWGWYDSGGDRHVAAYLATLDISSFDAKAPPPKTPAFWDIVDSNRPTEESELADVLDQMGEPVIDSKTHKPVLDDVGKPLKDKPLATTVPLLIKQAVIVGAFDFVEWLEDRKNRRALPHRLEKCGYIAVRNDVDKTDGLWLIGGKRQTAYALATLTVQQRYRAVQDLKKVEDEKVKEKSPRESSGKCR